MLLRLALALGAFTALALGQTTDATCSADFDWAKNAQGSIPCAVGSSLLAVCSQTKNWVVPKLTNGNTYRGPTANETNKCQCSTVTFSLLAACSLCQGSTPLSFAAWSEFCPPETITLNSFPFTNASVDIPLWALANTTNTGSFDLAQAKRIAGVKEPFPTIWIVVISLAIAAIFFLLFLAVFCYIRRHRVQTWMQRRRGGGGGGRNSATYAQIERKSFDAAGNPKPKKDRRKVKQRGGHGLDLDSESGSGRSVYQAPTNGSGYFAVSGYEDPFGARVPAPAPAPIPIAHQRHASASSINLLPDHPNAGYEVATVSSGKGNHPSKAYASGSGGGGSGSGGGGAPGKYSDRARAQAADNAMKRSDRSGVNVISGAAPPAQTTTQSSFGTTTTGSLGRNAMYQDVNPLSPPPPPPPAPASYGSSRSGRSGNGAEAVDPFVMVSPPASVTAFPRDVKRRPGLEHGHASQGSSSSLSPSGLGHGKNNSASSLATSHRHNASGSSLNLVPTTITSGNGNGNGRGYEQGPSQPMFQRTKQVASTRRDTVFDLDGGSGGSGQRVRTHSNASSFEMIDPATGLPAIQVSHPSPAVVSPGRPQFPGSREPFFGTPAALDPGRRAAHGDASSSTGRGGTYGDSATLAHTGTGSGSEGGTTMLTAGQIPPYGFSERGGRSAGGGGGGDGSDWGGGTLISTRLGHREDQYDAMTPVLPPSRPWADAGRRDTTDSPAPSVYAWAEQQMHDHPPAPSVADSEESHYTQRTNTLHQPRHQPSRSDTSASVYSQITLRQDASRGPSPMPVPPMPTTRSPSPSHPHHRAAQSSSYDRPLPTPPPPPPAPAPAPAPVERDPFATLRELAVASPEAETEGPDSARSQPWGMHTFAHVHAHAHGHGRNQSAGGWPNPAPPVRDRFADDYPSSSSSSGAWRR